MSRYDLRTGIFELTLPPHRRYWREPGKWGEPHMNRWRKPQWQTKRLADVLRAAGFEVPLVTVCFLHVRANPLQLHEALRGYAIPLDDFTYAPDTTATLKPDLYVNEPQMVSPARLGQWVEPAITGARINKILAEADFQDKPYATWRITDTGRHWGREKRSYSGSRLVGFVVIWSPLVLHELDIPGRLLLDPGG